MINNDKLKKIKYTCILIEIDVNMKTCFTYLHALTFSSILGHRS